MELKFMAPDHNMWKKEAAACDKDNGKDESITVRSEYPQRPISYFEFNKEFNLEKVKEIMSERYISIAQSIANDIIIPDPTPKKIFLDTTRLLAKKTNNLLEELWNYIEEGKLIQSAVLLLAAQEQIRGGCSSKVNGSSKRDGLDVINKRIVRLFNTSKWEKGSNGMAQRLLEERTLFHCAVLLVDVMFHAGEPLSAYIQAHSEVPNVEVLEHVSSILKEFGFRPTEEVKDTINLRPYDCKMSHRESCSKGANSAVMEMASLHPAAEKVTRKEVGSGWDPSYIRRSFFPYWRSVLRTRAIVKVYPVYATEDARSGFDLEQLRVSRSSPMVNGSTPTPHRKLGSVGLRTSNQPKRSFSIAAIGAFRLLKELKHA